MAKIKEKDVVRIKKEWCEGESDFRSLWVVLEVYDNTGRCMIALIQTEAEKKERPFGRVETVSFDMIEKGGEEDEG